MESKQLRPLWPYMTAAGLILATVGTLPGAPLAGQSLRRTPPAWTSTKATTT